MRMENATLIRLTAVRKEDSVLVAATVNTSLKAAMTATMYRATRAKKPVFRQVMKQGAVTVRMIARTVAAEQGNAVRIVQQTARWEAVRNTATARKNADYTV